MSRTHLSWGGTNEEERVPGSRAMRKKRMEEEKEEEVEEEEEEREGTRKRRSRERKNRGGGGEVFSDRTTSRCRMRGVVARMASVLWLKTFSALNIWGSFLFNSGPRTKSEYQKLIFSRTISRFQSVSVSFIHSQSVSVKFSQFHLVWLGQKRRHLLTTGRCGKSNTEGLSAARRQFVHPVLVFLGVVASLVFLFCSGCPWCIWVVSANFTGNSRVRRLRKILDVFEVFRRQSPGACFGTTKETKTPSLAPSGPTFWVASGGLKWPKSGVKWPKGGLKWPRSGFKWLVPSLKRALDYDIFFVRSSLILSKRPRKRRTGHSSLPNASNLKRIVTAKRNRNRNLFPGRNRIFSQPATKYHTKGCSH